MNDEFLTRFRKPPRREFAIALYERINAQMNAHKNFSLRRITFAAALGLALIVALAFSPQARAAFNSFVRQIGGITYIEPDEIANEPTPAPGEEPRVWQETVSLSEAQEKIPYEISLPTWVPEGFVMSQSVKVNHFSDTLTFVDISWSGPNIAAGPIILIVGQPVQWVVDLDHVTEVQINGQPAGLTGGGWDADSGAWDTHGVRNLTLTWMRGEAMYQLMTHAVTAEELIRMAESIP